jgi:short-subunit dehydrogenase
VQLRGRRVWLIGASSGIGAQLTRDLVRQGAVLAVSGRRLEMLEQVADTAAREGQRPLVLPLDVTDGAAVARVHGDLAAAWDHIDVLIYNSGVWLDVPVEAFDAEKAAQQVDVNLTGMMRAVAAVLPDMAARRQGDIVGMASLAGYRGYRRAIAYSASKAGAIAFLQALRLQLEPYNVGVTMLNPGFVESPLYDNLSVSKTFTTNIESASHRIVAGLLRGEKEIHFPKRLSWTMKLITALPTPIYEAIARRFM